MPRSTLYFLAAVLAGSIPLHAVAAHAAEPIGVRLDHWSPERGLAVSITVRGDADGDTTFSNATCCGIADAHVFVRDVRVRAGGHPLPVEQAAAGWSVRHAPDAVLTVTYRLRPSGPDRIAAGTAGQFRPLIHAGLFRLIGTTAFLLPVGRSGSDAVVLDLDATGVVYEDHFVSSFGVGVVLKGIRATRQQVLSAVYLGGPISLTLHDTPSGKVGIVHSGMNATFRAADLQSDALAIVETTRSFFGDSQPWYLVSVHGADQNGSATVGGGTGLTNSFAMFVAQDLDLGDVVQREHFRWVLAHEYFHQWNGLTLRVASAPMSEKDDTSVYWFSEGITEFYAMRLLTRAGLQSPRRSLDVLDHKLMRYDTNSRRDVGAEAIGPLFWTDRDGEQIPYLRGYLIAWYVELAARRSSGESGGLDRLIRTLVRWARDEPSFRVDNAFLVSYLGKGLADGDAEILGRFILNGGKAPFDANSFSPCLHGEHEPFSGKPVLQFAFAERGDTACFLH